MFAQHVERGHHEQGLIWIVERWQAEIEVPGAQPRTGQQDDDQKGIFKAPLSRTGCAIRHRLHAKHRFSEDECVP
ncbi:hypothetical protein [Sphingobium yanoikuyae]|nr:hypothetical protein [Sphingobium yanoikuyae]